MLEVLKNARLEESGFAPEDTAGKTDHHLHWTRTGRDLDQERKLVDARCVPAIIPTDIPAKSLKEASYGDGRDTMIFNS